MELTIWQLMNICKGSNYVCLLPHFRITLNLYQPTYDTKYPYNMNTHLDSKKGILKPKNEFGLKLTT